MWFVCKGSGKQPLWYEKLETEVADRRYRCHICGKVLEITNSGTLPLHM